MMAVSESQGLGIPKATAFCEALQAALAHARKIKPSTSIEPALTKADFEEFLAQLPVIFPPKSPDAAQPPDGKVVDNRKQRQLTIVEVVVRDQFNALVTTTPIDSPEFVNVWNLLDITNALAVTENCEATLVHLLVEALLDNQTIEECRKTFDFLESRREQLSATPTSPETKKISESKKLVMLRFCNELLRRLSRAEDMTFCGRVFIYMFQCFPLGDRSGVNLRGEYHTENVTTYETIPAQSDTEGEKMDVDAAADAAKPDQDGKAPGSKAVTFDAKNKSTSDKDKPLDTDALYPIFWSMQEYFSQPTKLFHAENFSKFKIALEATIVAFESVAQGQKVSKALDDTKDPSKKRKRYEIDSADDNSNFNPKYLTSRDLFELEISDLFFRRHILIQAIIILDFLRSLTTEARKKYAGISVPNKSVMYSDKIVSEEDDKWADGIKRRINEYLLNGTDGQYVHRIIQSVTSRDKGWIRWKMESCPPISKDPVSADDFNEARASAKRMATSKRLKPHPMGSLNLDFLKDEEEAAAMEKFKDPGRWQLPDVSTFRSKIADDDFDIGMAKSDKEKGQFIETKASKTWRALRIASRTRLAAFDKIDDWQDVEAIFKDPAEAEEDSKEEEQEEEGEIGRKPEDKRLILITGPPGAGKSSLLSMLFERQPRVFAKLLLHTSRKPLEGEADGDAFHFLDTAAFNSMADGDKFMFSYGPGEMPEYGASKPASDAISESGKVPVLLLDRKGVEGAKEWACDARIVFIAPPSLDELEARIKKAGKCPEDKMAELLKAAQEELEQSKSGDLYQGVVENGDLETAYKALEAFIYGDGTQANTLNGTDAHAEEDVAMQDGAGEETELNGAAAQTESG